jgi:hypothetical protein
VGPTDLKDTRPIERGEKNRRTECDQDRCNRRIVRQRRAHANLYVGGTYQSGGRPPVVTVPAGGEDSSPGTRADGKKDNQAILQVARKAPNTNLQRNSYEISPPFGVKSELTVFDKWPKSGLGIL